MKKINILVVTFLCAIVISVKANAAQIVGVNFEESYKDENINMTLQGTGLKTVVFFKAFVAGFYTDVIDQEIVLGQTAKRIEVEYFVKIPGKKLNNFTIDTMKKNVTNEQFNAIATEVDLMSQYFVDLKPGDRFSLTYIPGVGTKFAHNDQLTGVIQGKDFARALFSVWIGENPFDQNLKNQILGLDKDQASGQQQLALQVER